MQTVPDVTFGERLQVAASPEMKTAIARAAAARGMTIADWTRSALAAGLMFDGQGFRHLTNHVRLHISPGGTASVHARGPVQASAR